VSGGKKTREWEDQAGQNFGIFLRLIVLDLKREKKREIIAIWKPAVTSDRTGEMLAGSLKRPLLGGRRSGYRSRGNRPEDRSVSKYGVEGGSKSQNKESIVTHRKKVRCSAGRIQEGAENYFSGISREKGSR